MKFVIKNEQSGKYFNGKNPTFPAFGCTKEEAQEYDSIVDAVDVCARMPIMVLWKIEEVQ